MKKIKLGAMIVTGALLLVLAGCSSASADATKKMPILTSSQVKKATKGKNVADDVTAFVNKQKKDEQVGWQVALSDGIMTSDKLTKPENNQMKQQWKMRVNKQGMAGLRTYDVSVSPEGMVDRSAPADGGSSINIAPKHDFVLKAEDFDQHFRKINVKGMHVGDPFLVPVSKKGKEYFAAIIYTYFDQNMSWKKLSQLNLKVQLNTKKSIDFKTSALKNSGFVDSNSETYHDTQKYFGNFGNCANDRAFADLVANQPNTASEPEDMAKNPLLKHGIMAYATLIPENDVTDYKMGGLRLKVNNTQFMLKDAELSSDAAFITIDQPIID